MSQPLVEPYGGCMVVLKVSRCDLSPRRRRRRHRSAWGSAALSPQRQKHRTRQRNWLCQLCHYMIQPLVEPYGGCMVVLKVSWSGCVNCGSGTGATWTSGATERGPMRPSPTVCSASRTARAGNRRFWRLSALRAHTKRPIQTELHRKTLRALKRPRRARTEVAKALRAPISSLEAQPGHGPWGHL
jgi:hypothetical protein